MVLTYPKNRLKELREMRGMTLRDLAEQTGWLNQSLSNLELSKAELTWSKMIKLAEILDCSPLDIVSESGVADKDEAALLSAFRAMSTDDREDLIALARKFAKIGIDDFNKMRGFGETALYTQRSAPASVTVHELSDQAYDAQTPSAPKPRRRKK